MNRIAAVCVRAAKEKALDCGKKELQKRAPALAAPLAPFFWLRHPVKALYFFLLWQTARFGFALLKKYLKKDA